MGSSVLRAEERIGLIVAVAAHAALLALLVLRPPAAPVIPPPDRIEVTISEEVGIKSASPEPRARAASDVAPEIGEPAPPPPPAPRVEPPRPEPRVAPVPRPVVKPAPQPPPKPVAKPVVRATPAPRTEPRPLPRPSPRPLASPIARASPVARPAQRATASAAQSKATPARTGSSSQARATASPAARTGASRIGNDFLSGVQGGQTTGQSRNPPAETAGPEVRSSLLGAISRSLKPHWQGKVPEGADSEKLVTILRWNINRDGTLAGTPQVVRQEGITEANRPQAQRHAEQAIRAVQLAAPFELPAQYYDVWKRVTIRFDKRLSQ